MIGTDENRAVLHVEVIFWSGKRKTPPSLVSGRYCPHFVVTRTTEYLGVCFLDGDECAFDEPGHLHLGVGRTDKISGQLNSDRTVSLNGGLAAGLDHMTTAPPLAGLIISHSVHVRISIHVDYHVLQTAAKSEISSRRSRTLPSRLTFWP